MMALRSSGAWHLGGSTRGLGQSEWWPSRAGSAAHPATTSEWWSLWLTWQPATHPPHRGMGESAAVVASRGQYSRPRSHHKQLAFYGWPCGLPHSRHTLPTPMPMPFCFRVSYSQKLWTEITVGVQWLITHTEYVKKLVGHWRVVKVLLFSKIPFMGPKGKT